MIELIFDGLLRGSPSLTELAVGGIFPAVLPKDATFPAIHYLLIGGSSQGTFDTHGRQKYRVEVNCWGDSYNDAVTLRHAVISALDSYSQAGITINFLQSTDLYDHELLEYRALAEFYVYANFQ